MNYNCPNSNCSFYKSHTFVIKDGFYFRKNDSRKIQRFRCKSCLTRFCSETHKLEYRQKKRRVNYPLFKLLSSGVSLRRSAILLGINKNTAQKKLNYLGKKYKAKNKTLMRSFQKQKRVNIQFDDLVTKENSKLKPLSISIAVDEDTRMILSAQVSQIPAFGHLSHIAKKKYGFRKCYHRAGLESLFRDLTPIVDENAIFKSDEHKKYPEFVQKYFPKAEHLTFTSERAHVAGQGELKKVKFDPLFYINHTCALLRANINRLIRKTWCTTKDIERLRDHLEIFIYFYNKYYLKKRLTPI